MYTRITGSLAPLEEASEGDDAAVPEDFAMQYHLRYYPALLRVFNAMLQAKQQLEEGAVIHRAGFEATISRLSGGEFSLPEEEPYLEADLAEMWRDHLHGLEGVIKALERHLRKDRRKALSPLVGMPVWGVQIYAPTLEQKSINYDARPLKGEIDKRLADESARLKGRLYRRLDAHRQQVAGVTHYRWHSVHDDRVRDSHRANDGKIFAWDSPPATGHPGEDYHCRCYAEPIVDDALGERRLPTDDQLAVAPAIGYAAAAVAALFAGGVVVDRQRNKTRAAFSVTRRNAFSLLRDDEISDEEVQELEEEESIGGGGGDEVPPEEAPEDEGDGEGRKNPDRYPERDRNTTKYGNKTPTDDKKNYKRQRGKGKKGTRWKNIKDGSIWEQDRDTHGGGRWKRWPNERDWKKGKNRESVRADGSVRVEKIRKKSFTIGVYDES